MVGYQRSYRDIAGRYANEGYLCVAPDLIAGESPRHRRSLALMQALAMDDALEIFARQWTRRQKLAASNISRLPATAWRHVRSARCVRDSGTQSSGRSMATFRREDFSKLKVRRCSSPASATPGSIRKKLISCVSSKEYNLPVEIVSYDADHAFFTTRGRKFTTRKRQPMHAACTGLFRNHLGATARTTEPG